MQKFVCRLIKIQIVRKENSELPIIFLGTKFDLTDDICVDEDYIKDHKEFYQLFEYMPVSSKSGLNVELAFEKVTRTILEKIMY